jgi:predicted kinase
LRARRDAVHEARGHWLLALGELETAGRRPGLVLVGGLPGSGKSTLASRLAKEAGFVVVASDRLRKRLAGLDELAPATASFGEGLYTESWTRRTYAACFREAARHLCLGRRVVVDATFREELWRERFLDLARRLGVRHLLLLCSAEPDVIRRRMKRRRPGPSDADWEIHREAGGRWEALSERAAERTRNVDVGGTPSQSVARALEELSRIGLAGATAG